MGNSESSDAHKFDGCETLGYRVLGVQPDSPASRAGLVSFFDFLVGANGQLLFGIDDGSGGEYFEDVDFPSLLKSSVDQEVELCKFQGTTKSLVYRCAHSIICTFSFFFLCLYWTF